MTVKFKTLFLILVLSVSLGASAQAKNRLETFITGEDWLERLTLKQKFMSLYAPAVLFRKYHVPLRRPLEEYIPALDRILVENPYLEKEDVANIFASTVYTYEPESRSAIEWMASEFAPHDINYAEGYSPTLLLTRPAKENLVNKKSSSD